MRTKIKKGGMLALAILLVAAAVAAWSFVTPTQKLNNVSSAAGDSNARIVFNDPEFSFQLLRRQARRPTTHQILENAQDE